MNTIGKSELLIIIFLKRNSEQYWDMKIKSVSESYILISLINHNEFVAKINVKNRSEPSIKIYAGWYQRVRNFYENGQPKRVRNVYKYERK